VTRPRRVRGTALALVGLGGYGVCTAAVGVLAAVAATGPAPPPSLADGTLGRPITAVTPIAPSDRPTGSASTGSRAADPSSSAIVDVSALPSASQGSTAPNQAVAWRPDVIVLPTGRTAAVVDSGVQPDGALAIPVNPRVVGWWTGGALVGDPFGGIVLAGHVDSATLGIGVLSDLKASRPGQLIVLRSGTRVARYRIVSMSKVPQSLLVSDTDAFRQDVDARLVLITCGGPFDRATHSYQDNLVVVATPVVAGS